MKSFALLFVTFLMFSIRLVSCEIILLIADKDKKEYKRGDIVIVKVEIHLTHRNCPYKVEETKFEQQGVEIISATKWKEKKPGCWEKKLKVKITANKDEVARLGVKRICEKGGANEFIDFKLK
ncbi:MAG: hypothetical protein N3A01_04535 [Bacteroidales bacterium]|nr:hypothetical protein [Bacteroidales bacterium]